MNNWQRLEQVIKWTGMSTNAFAIGIGLKRSENLYQIKRGNFGISKELARLITVKYPMINRAWLLTGEGSMVLSSLGENANTGPGSNSVAIPFYMDDILSVANQTGLKPTSNLILPMFRGATFAAFYRGNSMQPSIPNGSLVIVRTCSVDSLIPGEIYLVTTNENTLVRKIRTVDNNSEKLQLIAENSEEYDDLILSKNDITTLHQILGVLINYQG